MERPSSYQPSDASATHTRSRRSSSLYDDGETSGGSVGRGMSKGGGMMGGGSATAADKSLEEHLSIRNKRATTSKAAASLYEIMDIASLDKTGPATWASSDWCAEARRSREFLRKAKAGAKNNGAVGGDGGGGRDDDVPSPRGAVGGDGGRGGKRTDDDDDARGGGHARRRSYKDGDDAYDGRSSSRGRTAVEGVETRGKVDGSGGGSSKYRSSASLPPLRRHDEDDNDGEDDDDDNGTFRTVSRGRWMDRDAPPPPAPIAISGGATRYQSNGGGGSEYYRIPRREQRSEDMRRPSSPRSPSPSSRGGSEYRKLRQEHSQSLQVQQPVQRRPSSSRSQSRGPPPPNDVGRQQRNEDGIIAGSVGNGRSVRPSTPGRIDGRSVRSSTPGRTSDRPLRSATPGRVPSSGYDNSSARSSSRSRTVETERRTAYRDRGGDVGLGVGDGVEDGKDLDDSRSARASTFHRADTVRSRGKSSGAEGSGRIGDPPMESWDSRSSSRHSIRRHEADSRRDRGEWQRHEEPQRRSSSRGGRIARSPPRDPSSERRSVSRTPSRRGESEPQGRSSSGRSYVGVGMSIDKSIRRGGKQSQSFDDRYAGRTTPSSRDEKSLPHSPNEYEQKNQQQGERHRQDTGDATDDSLSTESSKRPIKTSSSTHKSSERCINSKATVLSARSYSSSGTSDTPETGPLTSSSGKSSKGSFLKSRLSSFVGGGGNMTPSTPPQNIISDSRPSAPSKCLDMANEEIATCLFDSKGYCVRHPNVQLRKKKLLGGWNVMMINCPECCMEEMNRLKRVSKRMVDKDGASGGGIGGSGKEKNTKSTKKGPRVVPDREQKQRSSYQSPVGRSRSRSRSQKEAQDATDTTSARNIKSRSKSRQGRRSTPRSETACNKSPPVFEFDVPLDVHGDLISSRSSAPRSIKSHKSGSSKKSKQSGRSVKTNKSAKSTRTNKSGKSTRTNKTSKSLRGHGSSIKRQPRDHSNNSKRETSGRSSSVDKNKGKSRDSNNRSVSRESSRGPSQRVTRQGTKLCVAKMPFIDQYNREGSYTGEVNDYGQPSGYGKIKYKNGTEFEGKFNDGRSDEMDASMEKPKNGFSNWKSNTKTGKMEKEKRKEQELDDLRSFVDPILRSGSSAAGGGIGSQQGTHCNTPTNKKGVAVHGRVNAMKWSDVNGFSGLYTGDVNSQKVPDGCGIMQYTNGVVEQGLFCNGVFQPGPLPNSNHYGGDNGGVPSSSMSVWSLKSTPTMAFGQASHSVLEGHHDRVNSGLGASSVRGTPSSVHLCGPGGLYGNIDHV